MKYSRQLAALPVSLFALLSLGAAAPRHARGASHQPGRYCATEDYHQLDFFIGDWDTYDVTEPAKSIARNQVTRMLNGCALREVYTQYDGLHGESFSLYDNARRVWHQSWVTNHGSLLLMDGGLQGGNMVFTGSVTDLKGVTSLMRVTWIPQGKTVRETAVTSSDNGKSWKPVFDIVFRPHTAAK